jgi:hypothetical protein
VTLRALVLFEDRIPAGTAPIYLPAGDRAIYVRSGGVGVADEGGSRFLWAGSAITVDQELTLLSDDEDTVLWRWELADNVDVDVDEFCFRSAPAAANTCLLRSTCDLDDRHTWLMRCDTVTFPPGGVALTHLHQGPGIRVVQDGEITIETEGTSKTYLPGEAWAEKGVLPVFAPAARDRETVFVRCFVLPRAVIGSSSIRIVRPEDRAKPNTQSYRVLAERIMARARPRAIVGF